MANRKLTDLPELLSPADGDFLYIVDVSDTTESPQGTSKKIKKQNIQGTPPVLKQQFEYVSGDPDFTLNTTKEVIAVAWNGQIMVDEDWTQTTNTLTINFPPSVGDRFKPIF